MRRTLRDFAEYIRETHPLAVSQVLPAILSNCFHLKSDVAAAAFIDFYKPEYPCTSVVAADLIRSAGIELASAPGPMNARGVNATVGNRSYIRYRATDPPSAQVFTQFHEVYEIVRDHLGDILGTKLIGGEDSANTFAGMVQVPPMLARESILSHRLDIPRFQSRFLCSLSTALIRHGAELNVLRTEAPELNLPPTVSILYEHQYWSDTGTCGRALSMAVMSATYGFTTEPTWSLLQRGILEREGELFSLSDVPIGITADYGECFTLWLGETPVGGVNFLVWPTSWRGKAVTKALVQIVPSKFDELVPLWNAVRPSKMRLPGL